MTTVVPVVLSGGSGTRLWPLSRAMYPKQFIRFFSGQKSSFLGATLDRLSSEQGFADPIILCNNDHRFLVQEELESAGITDARVILEPVARNTAAAIAVAAFAALEKSADAVIAVMPSDHVVRDPDKFAACVREAGKIASTGQLVLFGITPDEPHTGFGYIRRGAPLGNFKGAFTVDAFCEKPDIKTAQGYLSEGNHDWNSGIFVLHAKTFLQEMERLHPQIMKAAQDSYLHRIQDLGFERLQLEAFARSPSISVDYAVMEQTSKAVMLPIDVGWNDVGSWASLWEIAQRDLDDNFVKGEAVLEDTSGCYIHAERGLVATIGVRDLVVVDTPDALLVADRSRSQEVSTIVKRLKAEKRKEQEQHLRNLRPWGFFETLSIGPRFQVKLLHVKPGGKLSMQMHHHRSEHWIVVQGTAMVTIGDIDKLVRENESVYIFATQWHRLENPGKVPLEIIEVQIGTYLGEDDIVRTDDIYQRAADETK
ncbi:MAG: mannose-1-phosphate guanylyltransferase/mannose-6-phosphate isomerase [Pseudomonadota bacterium]